jgi:hypothetical protein
MVLVTSSTSAILVVGCEKIGNPGVRQMPWSWEVNRESENPGKGALWVGSEVYMS